MTFDPVEPEREDRLTAGGKYAARPAQGGVIPAPHRGERDWSKKGYGRKTAGIPPRCILLDAYVLPVYTFKIAVRS